MKTIEEKNRMIAEFMGYEEEQTENGEFVYAIEFKNPVKLNDIQVEFFFAHELKYHTSWDWLMPVVEQIENIYDESLSDEVIGYHLYDVEIRQNVCYIHGANIECSFSDKLTNTYEAVCEFIKMYNENK